MLTSHSLPLLYIYLKTSRRVEVHMHLVFYIVGSANTKWGVPFCSCILFLCCVTRIQGSL